MGRPPIGKSAMSGAERIRRYRAKHGIDKRQHSPDISLQTSVTKRLQCEADALRAQLAERDREIAQLKAKVAALKERIRVPEAERASPQRAAAPPKPERKQEQPDRAAMAAHMQADHEAYVRECAQWGGRPKSLVIDDIERLLRVFHRPDDVTQTIIDTLAPHVRDQAKINRGIPRRTFRKVLADLHPDRNPANVAAYIAFKALDVKNANGKPNRNTIVIADDKVRTMSDLRRKDEERRARAREKRKAK